MVLVPIKTAHNGTIIPVAASLQTGTVFSLILFFVAKKSFTMQPITENGQFFTNRK